MASTPSARGIHDHPSRRLGRQPKDPSLPKLKLESFFDATAVPPHDPADDNLGTLPFQLYENDSIGDCVAPDTKVLTADLRWVRAGELNIDDKLVAFDEMPHEGFVGRQYREATVTKAHIVARPCYELEFEDGTIVRCSSGHKWLTRSTVQGELKVQRWSRTEDLKLGPTRQSKIVKSLDPWDFDQSYEAGYLAGAFDGEGNLELSTSKSGSYANRVCFSQVENPMLEQVEEYLTDGGFSYSKGEHSSGTAVCVDGSPRKQRYRIAVGPRSNWLRFLGSVRPARLLPKLEIEKLGRIHGGVVKLVRKEFIGEQDVVMLDTSTGTYFAEGLASHNCGPTSVGNNIIQVTAGQTIPTTDQVIDFYSRVSGFDPVTGKNDNGVILQEMLGVLLKGGLGGKFPVAFAAVDHTNQQELEAAINTFDGVLLGVDLQVSQQKQSDAKTPVWDYASPHSEWGGHAILSGKYVDSSGRVTVISWAEHIDTTSKFREEQLDEVWVVVWPEHLTRPGVDVNALAAAFLALTGKSLPVPPPAPTPAPSPAPPAPTPSGYDTLDQQMWQSVSHWVGEKHNANMKPIAAALKRWAEGKGLA